MDRPYAGSHRVAIVRVEVRSRVEPSLLIEMLEVDRHHGPDYYLGSATDAAGCCRLLQAWLSSIVSQPEGESC